MNAIELLMKQHREVETLLEELRSAGENAIKTKTRLFEKVADKIAIHSTIEEEIFYPEARQKATNEFLLEAVNEHLGVKRIITDLLATSPEDENFDPMVAVLHKQIFLHKEQEEKILFPKLEELLGGVKLEELAIRMERRARELEKLGGARLSVPSQTAAPSPIDKPMDL